MGISAAFDGDRNLLDTVELEAVAAAEGMEIPDADVDAEITKLAGQYSMEEDKVRSIVNLDDVRHDLLVRKALELVKSAAKKPARKSAKKADKAEEAAEEPEETEE